MKKFHVLGVDIKFLSERSFEECAFICAYNGISTEVLIDSTEVYPFFEKVRCGNCKFIFTSKYQRCECRE